MFNDTIREKIKDLEIKSNKLISIYLYINKNDDFNYIYILNIISS